MNYTENCENVFIHSFIQSFKKNIIIKRPFPFTHNEKIQYKDILAHWGTENPNNVLRIVNVE